MKKRVILPAIYVNIPPTITQNCKFTPLLTLDHAIFPHCTKKGPKMPAKPLHSLKDLAHTVDERFVLAYPADPLPLVALSWEETLPGVAHF
ncbi:hypothetical protein DSO57_1001393 [Entomophthora muscae]|uniref:Uncharacterized protein n=1 Tax=Entomophthora muscae TaxID=34485 RepID=A0ACC2TJL1_9FUNG|nr:hypothetical protein DSO57_1001393 [Entomophthora muscae]